MRNAKIAALIRQANSRYGLANKPKIKKKDVWWKRRERKQNSNNKQTLSEKKEEAGNVSEQRDKGWVHVIRVTRYNPLSSDNTAGQQTLTRLLPLTRTS